MTSRWRWSIVATLFVCLVVLAELSLETIGDPLSLGVRIARQDGGLVVTAVDIGGIAYDAGIAPGDVVVEAEGEPVGPGTEPSPVESARSIRVSTTGGEIVNADVATGQPVSMLRVGSFLILAIAFAAIGSTVFILGVDLVLGWTALGFSSFAAAGLLAAIATPTRAWWALALVPVALVGATAFIAVLFLVFPVNRLKETWARVVGSLSLIVAALAVIPHLWVFIIDPSAFGLAKTVGFAAIAVNISIACSFAIVAARTLDNHQREVERALSLVALGTVGGLAPFLLLSILPFLLGFGHPVPPDIAILPVVLLPASLAVAILSRQFLGIRWALQRGLIAVVVWFLLLSIYGAILAPLHTALKSTVLVVAATAGTFPFVERRVRRYVERRVFRDIYDYAETLQSMATEIVALTGLDAVADHVLSRLQHTLDLRWVGIVLSGGDASPQRFCRGACPEPADFDSVPATDYSPGVLHPLATPRGPVQVLPLIAEGERIGLLVIGGKHRDVELTPEDAALVSTMAPLIATALRNAMLVRSLERQVAALAQREAALAALSAQLMRVQEREQQQLALELHDDPLQRAILLSRSLAESSDDPLARRWHEAVEEIIVSLRAICTDLRPPVLDDFGLAAGLERLANNLRARSDLDVSLAVEAVGSATFGRLPPDAEVALYRVAQEALNNTLKHAQANRVEVILHREGDRLYLTVEDDGRGFVVSSNANGRLSQLGIMGMRERLRPWDGALTVQSSPGEGTRVTAEINLRGG